MIWEDFFPGSRRGLQDSAQTFNLVLTIGNNVMMVSLEGAQEAALGTNFFWQLIAVAARHSPSGVASGRVAWREGPRG
jgi:hypothetical protein